MSKGIEWDRLRRLIQDVAESQGYELVDVEFKGSGKSSVFGLLKEELRARRVLGRRVELARVTLWPFVSIDAAIAAVLKELIAAIRHGL